MGEVISRADLKGRGLDRHDGHHVHQGKGNVEEFLDLFT